MKDLFVLAADSDCEAVLRSVLSRHEALQIRPIKFDVRRFPGRDSGMVNEGPETARFMVKKNQYHRLLLIWDQHGSGWERKGPETSMSLVQQRLDGITWMDRSESLVVVPELEEWLWHCPDRIAVHLGLGAHDFQTLLERAVGKFGKPLDFCMRHLPKELFGFVLYGSKRRKPLPGDFAALGSSADLTLWNGSASFTRLNQILRTWFPPEQ